MKTKLRGVVSTVVLCIFWIEIVNCRIGTGKIGYSTGTFICQHE